jgi:hypothetical protein
MIYSATHTFKIMSTKLPLYLHIILTLGNIVPVVEVVHYPDNNILVYTADNLMSSPFLSCC